MNVKSKLLLLLFICLAFLSCKKDIIKTVPSTDSTSIKTEALKPDTTALKPVDTLNSLVGKSVFETKLLTKSSLTSRLKNLLGSDYDKMVKYWNTETSFTRQEDILHASGCKQHDCTTYSYDLYIDLKNNKMNVYQFSKSKLTVFKEDDFNIELKDAFLEDLNAKKSNANIPKEN